METRQQQILVIVVSAVFLIIASISTVVFFMSGGMRGDVKGGGYKNVTFTDAVIACEKKVKNEFNKKIITLEVDDHSSRYENKRFMYKIFFKANIRSKKNKHGNMHYINCFVKSSNGDISKLEILEENEIEAEAVTENETNAFGLPK